MTDDRCWMTDASTPLSTGASTPFLQDRQVISTDAWTSFLPIRQAIITGASTPAERQAIRTSVE
jgi:hypothetical protein